MSAYLLSLALALGADDASALDKLAGELSERLSASLEEPVRTVVEIDEPERLLVAPGALERGQEVEILRRALPIRDPESLAPVGWLMRPVASARVIDSARQLALLEPVAAQSSELRPRVGDEVRPARGSMALGLSAVPGDPSLEDLSEALVSILAYRLERTGLFSVRRLAASAPSLLARAELASLRQDLDAQGLDIVASLAIDLEGGVLIVVSEILGSERSGIAEVVSVSAAVDASVERYLYPPSQPGREGSSPTPLAEFRLPGPILALAGLGEGAFAALTESGLYRLTLDGRAELLLDLTALSRARLSTRQPAGSLSVAAGAAATRIGFGTNRLASGYVWVDGRVQALDGVPVASREGEFLLAGYREGESVFDGSLRAGGAGRDVGPFLRLERSGDEFVLQRPDLRLIRLGVDLAARASAELRSGDAWSWQGELRALSGLGAHGEPDVLSFQGSDGRIVTWRFARSLEAVTLGPAASRHVAVALAGPAGASSLMICARP